MLARELEHTDVLARSEERIVVIGLARGGVEVAAEVATALHAPLDALAVRKAGHPRQPEYGIGAVAPGGIEYVRSHDGLTNEEVADAVRVAAMAADALDAALHAQNARIDVADTTCVLVDDGLATGGTMVAAVRWARARGAGHVVVAVPVGALATLVSLEHDDDVDAVVTLLSPADFGAVGFWYEEFRQLTNEDVVELLSSSEARSVASTELIPVDGLRLVADLSTPARARGWVVFAHGSGSSRRSLRNVSVAASLNRAGIATLLFDLLTHDEEAERQNVFDVELLAQRLIAATRWLSARSAARGLPIGYFGASTGAAAALLAAAELGDEIAAVVSRGGRPDLARNRLVDVQTPTLLIVGGADRVVLDLNEAAAAKLTCPSMLEVVPGATHLFEEPGALDRVAELATEWFTIHFAATQHAPERPATLV
jgi:putative phosphoribosyl transferase